MTETATRRETAIPSAYRSLARQAGVPLSEVLELAREGRLHAVAQRAATRSRMGAGIQDPHKALVHLAAK